MSVESNIFKLSERGRSPPKKCFCGCEAFLQLAIEGITKQVLFPTEYPPNVITEHQEGGITAYSCKNCKLLFFYNFSVV